MTQPRCCSRGGAPPAPAPDPAALPLLALPRALLPPFARRSRGCPSGSGSGSPWGEGAPLTAALRPLLPLPHPPLRPPPLPPPSEGERRRERRGAPGRRRPSPSTRRRSSGSAWRRPRGPCRPEPTRAARTSVSFEGKNDLPSSSFRVFSSHDVLFFLVLFLLLIKKKLENCTR